MNSKDCTKILLVGMGDLKCTKFLDKKNWIEELKND